MTTYEVVQIRRGRWVVVDVDEDAGQVRVDLAGMGDVRQAYRGGLSDAAIRAVALHPAAVSYRTRRAAHEAIDDATGY